MINLGNMSRSDLLDLASTLQIAEKRGLIQAPPKPEPSCDWHPDARNIPQCEAYGSLAREILYGGAAGGGKSDLLLGLARQEHQSSLLLRREFPDLERSLIKRSLEFYGPRDLYNGSKHYWRIGTRSIEFGHLEHMGTELGQPGDEDQYASAAYDLIGFDQLEQFNRYVYEFMFSRNRTTLVKQRLRVAASMNPVGEYLDWIIDRWGPWLDDKHPRPAKSGEIRWYRRDEKGRDIETEADHPDAVSRTFIASRLADNPYLGDDYRRTLMLMPEPLRSALLNGDIKAAIQDDAYQVIPRAWVKAAQARWTPDGHPKDKEGRALALTKLGADIARGGDDKEVLTPRYGNWFGEQVKIAGALVSDGARGTKPIIEYLESMGEAKRTTESIEYKDAGITLPKVESTVQVNVDVVGIGSSVYDTCRTHGVNAIAVNWGSGSDSFDRSGKLQFLNKRAEHWWNFREALDPQIGEEIALPPDSELLADLCAPRWTPGSKIKIEAKEDIKKRIGRSPDCGDSAVLAYADEASLQIFI